MEQIPLDDPRVQRAISFVEEQAQIGPERQPWIYYSPVWTIEEQIERDQLIDKYGRASPDHLDYYLFYHNCDDFAVFYWTVLRAKGIRSKIVSQSTPFRHTYLQDDSGEVLDVLLSKCGVDYPHRLNGALIFDTPHDFYAELFIHKEGRKDWEVELLEELRQLE